jgi:hypothetical protein
MARKHKVGFDKRSQVDDEPTSLLRTLELSGNLKAHSQVQMELAYKHYVRESMAPKEIAKLIAVRPDVIEKWVVLFGWDEDRAQHQLNQWRKVASIAHKKGVDVDKRADRIMHTIESAVESLLHQHHEATRRGEEEGQLTAKDLATLATCIKTTRGERNEARGKVKNSVTEHRVRLDVEGSVDILHRIGAAVTDVIGQNRQIESAREGHTEAEIGQIEDAEYEVLDDD